MDNEYGTTRRRRRFGITTAGCTAAVVIAGALAAPAAHASSATDLTTGLGSTVTGVGSTVTGVGSAVSTTGTLLTGTGSTTPTTTPVVTTPILTAPVLDLTPVPTTGLPGLATVDGDGTGLTVDVGSGLVTVGAGTGSSTGSGISVGIGDGAVGATTGGSTTVSTGDPTAGAPSVGGGSHIGVGTGTGVSTPTVPGVPTGSTSPAPAPSPSTVPGLLSATIDESVATVYPKKDGYRDTVTFLVKHETSTGAVIPVVGSAVLTKAGRTVKTWALVRSTQKLVWNGLVDGSVKPGTYLLRATAHAADGRAFTSSTRTVVSAQRLVTKSVSLTTGAVTKLTHKAMPKPARTSLVKGLPVRLRVITSAKGIEGVGRLVFTAGKKSFSVPVRSGKHTSGSIRVPKAFTAVHMRPVLKAKHGTVRTVKLVWTYGQLK